MSAASFFVTPYKGLMPYEEEEADAQFFFGRESEREIIIANLMASRMTLLYGTSGVGKSSVLRAGVAFRLRQLARQNIAELGSPEFAVVVFRDWRDDPIVGLTSQIHESLRQLLSDRRIEPETSASLAQTLQAWTERIDGDLLIILDQFEDYFLYHEHEDGEGTFALEFPRAVNNPALRVSFLISIREESLAKLDRFAEDIPQLFDNRLPIEHLDREAARDAIEKPKNEYNRVHAGEEPVVIEEKLIEEVLKQVETGQVIIGERGRGVVKTDAADPRIETPYLQLVMKRLWEDEMRLGSRVLRLETLSRLGDPEHSGAENIVRAHLDAAMDAFSDEDKDVAANVFHYLVTPDVSKIALTATALASYGQKPLIQVTPLLDRLCTSETRILRPVPGPPNQPDKQRYEIFHDVLAPAILDWRRRHVQAQELTEAKRRAASEAAEREKEAARQRELKQAQSLALEQQRRAEAERQRADEKAKVARRLKVLSRALVVMVVLALVAALVALKQKWKADANASEAQAQEKSARENAELAQKNKQIAMAAANINGQFLSLVEELSGFGNDDVKDVLRNFNERLEFYRKLNDRAGEGIILYNIAGLYRAWGQSLQWREQYQEGLGKYQEALNYYQRALDKLRSLGADLPYIAQVLNDMGAAYQEEGEYPKAKPLFDEALAVLEKLVLENTLQPDDPELVPVLFTLAECHRLQGKFAAAEPFYNRALKIQQETLPSDHPNIARILDQLAVLYSDQNRLKRAEQTFRQAQEIWEKKTEYARSLGDSYNGLADAYRKERNYSEAKRLLDGATINHKKTQDLYRLDIAYDKARLARVYYDQGKYAKAEQLFHDSLTVLEKGLGSGHPDVALVRSNLASLYYKQGNTKAEELFKKALHVQESVIPYHPDLAETLENYAALLRKTNQQKEEAAKMEERAKSIRDRHMQEDPKD
jgi:tetratricopeptide (TPR) repeat protein